MRFTKDTTMSQTGMNAIDDHLKRGGDVQQYRETEVGVHPYQSALETVIFSCSLQLILGRGGRRFNDRESSVVERF